LSKALKSWNIFSRECLSSLVLVVLGNSCDTIVLAIIELKYRIIRIRNITNNRRVLIQTIEY
jgi:hypothetical protein